MRTPSEMQKKKSDPMQQNSINTIFFDVGGVLSVDFIEKKILDLARKYHVPPDALMAAKKKYRPLADLGQISDQEFWILALHEIDVNATEVDWNLDAYVQAIEGVREVAEELKMNGYAVAILSNDSRELGEKRRRTFGYDALFQDVIISYEHGLVKPDPPIYELALQRLNVSAEQSVIIDDRLENVNGGERVGMRGILFKNTMQLKDELIHLGLKLTF